MCKDMSELSEYARVDNTAFRMIKNNTPGPYTFILKDGTQIPVRTRDNGTNNVVEYYSVTKNQWCQIFLMTKGLNTSFVDYNTTQYNNILFIHIRRTNNIQRTIIIGC